MYKLQNEYKILVVKSLTRPFGELRREWDCNTAADFMKIGFGYAKQKEIVQNFVQ